MTDLLDPLPSEPGTRRKQNTRTRLVRASLAVFTDRGIDGATIDDLVSAAGFTRGAFYSNFSRKEEVFAALFELATDEVIERVRETVGDAAVLRAADREGCLRHDAEDAAFMVSVFEAIRPHGRQWYLLYSEAIAHALRTRESIEILNTQRGRLRTAIAEALRTGMAAKSARCVIGVEQLAQMLIGVFVDFMVQENLDDSDITGLAGETILRVVEAFTEPVEPPL